MAEFLEHERQQQELQQSLKPLKRELDSTDDFEHLEHEFQQPLNNHHHYNEQKELKQEREQQEQRPLLDLSSNFVDFDGISTGHQPHNFLDGFLEDGPEKRNLLDTSVPSSNGIECDLQPTPATPPPSADLEKYELGGAARQPEVSSFGGGQEPEELGARLREQLEDFRDTGVNMLSKFESPEAQLLESFGPHTKAEPRVKKAFAVEDDGEDDMFTREDFGSLKEREQPPMSLYGYTDIKSSSLPEPEHSPELDFVKDEIIVHEATRELPRNPEDELWNVLEKSPLEGSASGREAVVEAEPPNKPLPPVPSEPEHELYQEEQEDRSSYGKDLSNEYVESRSQQMNSESDIDEEELEFESEPESSPPWRCPMIPPKSQPAETTERMFYCQKPPSNREIEEIAPKDIFRRIGVDAWFNPERLNPKVASLIYWHDPKKSGIVFGTILVLLLSLAYFSLISVLSYISLLSLLFTISFRIYKTVLQAIQKTSDGHPFKDILELDLTLPSSKVHEIADIAVANANAGVTELRRLFLVEDFVDSIKFGILMWTFTYLGSWFNGMTLVIILVVALFTLPKIYETNKTQIDQNLALVQAKLNEITAKVRAALPLGKKAEALKAE